LVLSRSAALAEPMLEPEEERRLIRAWQDQKDVAARDAVVRAYARLCYRIAANYSKNPDHIEDLAQEGSLGILRALDKYDPDKGVKFSTYSRFWVQNFISAATASTVNVVTVPARAFMDARMGRLPEGKNDAAVLASRPAVSLESQMEADGSKGEILLDRLMSEEETPEDIAIRADVQKKYENLIGKVLSRLSERENTVIRLRRLSDPPATLEDISKLYNVSRERIRQIEVSAMIKMEELVRSEGFDPGVFFSD